MLHALPEATTVKTHSKTHTPVIDTDYDKQTW